MSSLFNVFLFIGLISVSVRNVRALTEEETSEIQSSTRSLAKECGKDFGVEEEDILKAKQSGMIDSVDPCIFACIGKKVGMINDKGEFDTEMATEMIKNFFADEEAQKKALEVIEICSSVNEQSVGDDEGCERAVLLSKCLDGYKDRFPTF